MRQLVESHAWIKTPFAYTRLSNRLSLIQQNALLMVSDHLQQYIRDFYNLHLDKSKKRPKSLFSEHLLKNGIPAFRIYLADLGVQPNNYKVVREAIEEMNVLVEHPVIDENGLPTGETALNPVFEEFRVKETGDYYHYERESDEGVTELAESARHYGYIDVQINHKVAEWAFDMSAGYVNHLKQIARYSTKRPTPRLYLMLMRELGQKKQKARFTIQELKEYLGIVPYKDEKTGQMVTPYPKFAHFRAKVLDSVKADLDRMAALDQTDIKFEYTLIYPGDRKRGEPEFVEFDIIRTKLGDAYNVIVNHQAPEKAEPRQQDLFMGEYKAKFDKCMEEMLAKLPTDEAKAKLSQMQFEHWDASKKTLYIQIPDTDYYKWVESDKVIRFVGWHLAQHFGKKTILQYRVLSKSPNP